LGRGGGGGQPLHGAVLWLRAGSSVETQLSEERPELKRAEICNAGER